ncbi:hypothetical protein FKP32DRAFT_1760684 [Trametes sanguinea]|nr:hypothetical protein FKP32DRAFT_1760684 [Trametes sanguinea]
MSPGSATTFLDLPREVVVGILKHLDYDEIARCRMVCSTLNALVNDNASLLYKIELGIENLQESPVKGLSSSERLNFLLDRRVRWLTLDWSYTEPLSAREILPQSALPYELQGGTFLNITSRAGNVTMNKITLPSRADLQPRYTSHDLEFKALDVTTDPTQDLLVVLDIDGRINLWSLSTHRPHPEAATPILRPEGADSLFITALHVTHDLVGLVEWAQTVQVTIWNWRTGRTIILGNDASLTYFATGLAWLSPRAFVLSDAAHGELNVFSLEDIDCTSPAEPLSFHNLAPRARLQLPRVDNIWHMSYFQLESTPLLAAHPRDRPFVASPDSHIVVFTMQYVSHNHRRTSSQYTGFVHAHHLMTYLDARTAGEPSRIVPWSQWGPKNTRIVPQHDPTPTFSRYVHGQRVVLSRRHHTHQHHQLFVYDFNVHPRRVETALHAQGDVSVIHDETLLGDGATDGGAAEVYVGVVDVPTIIPPGSQSGLQYHPFLETVESSLPYIETSKLVEGGLGRNVQFMMDDERLIEFNPRRPRRFLHELAFQRTASVCT